MEPWVSENVSKNIVDNTGWDKEYYNAIKDVEWKDVTSPELIAYYTEQDRIANETKRIRANMIEFEGHKIPALQVKDWVDELERLNRIKLGVN